MTFLSSQLHGGARGCAQGGRGRGVGVAGVASAELSPPEPVNLVLSPGKAGVRPEQGALASRLPLTFPEWEVCSLGGPAIFHVHCPQNGFLGGRQGCEGSRLWLTWCAWQDVAQPGERPPPRPTFPRGHPPDAILGKGPQPTAPVSCRLEGERQGGGPARAAGTEAS